MNLRLTRRRFLLGCGAIAAGTGLYTWRIEPHWVEIVHRDLPVRHLTPELDGRTLAQVSDLHLSPQVDGEYLSASLRKMAALEPDIVAFTGDFMSEGNPDRIDEVARLVEGIANPPLGCFAILGNHDYGERWMDSSLAERLTSRLNDAGIQVLRNAARTVKGLTIAGVDDLWATNFNPGEVLPGLDPRAPTIVLCHNPDAVDRKIWGGFQGWILSGHTHGGQCKPPFLPPPLLPVANRRYTAGEFDLGDGRRMYINRGLGHLLRVRFNVRPEITLFRLRPA
jgi:predicted MPP superfamily phosphohydrolase